MPAGMIVHRVSWDTWQLRWLSTPLMLQRLVATFWSLENFCIEGKAFAAEGGIANLSVDSAFA